MRVVMGAALAAFAIGCSDDETTRTMEPVVLGMTSDLGATFDDGEITIFEVRAPVQIFISQPTQDDLSQLNQTNVVPYGRRPWITTDDVKVQVSWTLTNLDPEPHDLEILLDPWNEFGRYWPGLALVDAQDEEFLPNYSGIDLPLRIPGTSSGEASRKRGTFTYQDMDEVAIDFATAMNIIQNGPAPDPADPDSNPQVTYVNHAFALENRSFDDPLVAPYIPGVIAGLVGFDIGLRTREPANLAIEIVVEVRDLDSGKVLERDDTSEPIPVPNQYITVGYGG